VSRPERFVQEALEAAGDHAGAFLWRRLCRDLDGDLRVGVAARDEAAASRLIVELDSTVQGRVEWVPLHLELSEGAPGLGAQDRLLGVHALLWGTSYTAALGSEERAVMASLVAHGAPDRRTVVLDDAELLERVSDRPQEEAGEVQERAEALVRGEWEVLPAPEVARWVETARGQRLELARGRRRAVGELLLRDARERTSKAVDQARAELTHVEELLQTESAHLEEARARGRRAAAHILGAVRRQTEQLLVDLRTFLVELESDLPAQIEAVDELETVRRALPHWLHQVVEQWMGERLASWRGEVLRDLAEVRLDPDDLDRAELLVPALHPSPVRAEPAWGQRLGVTAAVGSGAALLAFGLWLPGVLAVTGGIAWSALGQRARQAHTRRMLIDAAIDAVRGMGQDAERLLREQIQLLETELDRLGEDRAGEVADARSEHRQTLETQKLTRTERLQALQSALDELDARIEILHRGAQEAG
jgi:hypothetical protein